MARCRLSAGAPDFVPNWWRIVRMSRDLGTLMFPAGDIVIVTR
jgi:hypothetical protein